MIQKMFSLVIAGAIIFTGCTPTPPPQVTMPPANEVTEVPVTHAPVIQGGYFGGFPDEYQNFKLPQEITDILNAGGSVVPLPSDPVPFQSELESVAQSYGYDLSNYDLNRVVSFTSEDGFSYISVPSKINFAKDSGCTGLIFDKSGAYDGNINIYEVRFFEDRAVLRDSKGNEIILYNKDGNFFTSPEVSPGEIPLVVFIHNGCWFCGCVLGKCGCVFCK